MLYYFTNFNFQIIYSSKMKLFLLSVLLAILLVMVIAVSMPDPNDDDEDFGNEITTGASAELENNAMSMSQAKILTSFKSYMKKSKNLLFLSLISI